MRSPYDTRVKQTEESDTGSSFMRVGLLFGSLALALGLVLIPVYMKRDDTKLMDTQYTTSSPKNVETVVGAH